MFFKHIYLFIIHVHSTTREVSTLAVTVALPRFECDCEDDSGRGPVTPALQICNHQWSPAALSFGNSIILLVDVMRLVKPLELFHDLVKTTQKERGRLMGLDVGDKYVGLALSDFDNKIASPFSVLVRKKTNTDLMASDFESLISKYSLKGFVIGLPFDKFRVSTDAVQVKVFIDGLCRTKMLGGLKYTYWNECFTSKNVELLLKPLNLNHPVHSKTMLDKFAAVGILQGYLDYVNRKMKQIATE